MPAVRPAPLAGVKKLGIAFQHKEGFGLAQVGMGWRAAARRRCLNEGGRQPAGRLSGDENLDGFSKDFEDFGGDHNLACLSREKRKMRGHREEKQMAQPRVERMAVAKGGGGHAADTQRAIDRALGKRGVPQQ